VFPTPSRKSDRKLHREPFLKLPGSQWSLITKSTRSWRSGEVEKPGFGALLDIGATYCRTRSCGQILLTMSRNLGLDYDLLEALAMPQDVENLCVQIMKSAGISSFSGNGDDILVFERHYLQAKFRWKRFR
jgi:hypothetical protein